MKARKGLTLLELMIGLALASIISLMIAVVSAQLMQAGVGNSRAREAEARVGLALAVLDRSISNAGVGFVDSRYAFRIYNNLPAGSLAVKVVGGNLPVVAKGGAAAGIVENTDVFEVSFDDQTIRRAGVVVPNSTVSCGGDTCAVTLATGDPFLDTELTAIGGAAGVETGPLVLFTNDQGRSCLGRAKGPTGAPPLAASPRIDFVMKTEDGANAAAVPVQARWGGANVNCPQAGDAVYALGRRRRFMVWQDANGANLGLYSQEANVALGGSSGLFPNTAPALSVAEVENLQVAPSLPNPGMAPGPLGCSQALCRCNDAPAPGCVLNSSDHPPNGTDRRSNVRLVSIELTQRAGLRQTAQQPNSYDWPGPSPVDNVFRVRGETTISLVNMFLVTQ